MNSLKLQSGLTDNTFSEGNHYFSAGNSKYSMTLYYLKEIPVLCYNYGDEVEEGLYHHPYWTSFTFSGRNLTKVKFMEVLQTARLIQIVRYNQCYFAACQGFLAKYNEISGEIGEVIFFHTVNRFMKREDVLASDINIHINRNFLNNPEEKKVEVIVKEFMKICEGTVTLSYDPLSKFEKRFIFKSKSIQGIKKELEYYGRQIFRKLKDSSIKSIVSANLIPAIYDPVRAQHSEVEQHQTTLSLREDGALVISSTISSRTHSISSIYEEEEDEWWEDDEDESIEEIVHRQRQEGQPF